MSVDMERISMEPICDFPPDATSGGVTNDGHVVVFRQQEDGKARVCWDGVCGDSFDRFLTLRDTGFAIVASQDGNHIAYVGVRDGRAFVGRDGGEDPPFEDAPIGQGDAALLAAAFSPDCRRIAFVEMRGEGGDKSGFRIVLDGRPGDWFRGLRNATGTMQFSPDSRRFANYTTDGKGQGQWFVDGIAQRVINGWDATLGARFSPDSSRFAYGADIPEKGVAIIEDAVVGPAFKGVYPPAFSPDSRHLAYGALTHATTVALVLDGVTVGDWPATSGGRAVFSANGDRVAMMLGREEGGIFRKRRWYSVAVDGRRSPEVEGKDSSAYPTFSPDGGRVAWWIQQVDRVALVVDGAVQDDRWSVYSELRFDPMGGLVYAARIGNSKTVVYGHQPGPAVDEVQEVRTLTEALEHDPLAPPPTFFRISAAGRVAWAGVIAGKVHPIFDDELGPAFDTIIGCRVDTGAAATWWARRDNVIYRIDRAMDAVSLPDQPQGTAGPS